MADKPVNEVVQVDAILDALVSPTSSDVYEALGPYSNDAVAAVAAKRAAAGGGSTPTLADVLAAGSDGSGSGMTNTGGITTGGGGISTGTGTITSEGGYIRTDGGTFRSGGGDLELAGGSIFAANNVEIDGDLNHDGAGVGFYGTAPVARQTLPINPTVDDIRDALVALGLVLQDS